MIVLQLPIAPPLSKLYTKQRHLTGVYRAWRLEAGLELNSQRVKFKALHTLPIISGANICVDLPYIPNGDLDNRFKATLDLLTQHEILLDDKMKVVDSLSAAWRTEIPRDRMKVTIFTREELTDGSPANPH